MRLEGFRPRPFEWSLAMAKDSAVLNPPPEMSVTTSLSGGGTTHPTAALFQKAHSKVVALQRVDEQLTGLIDQRRRLQEELRSVQKQINEELDRVLEQEPDLPARNLADRPTPVVREIARLRVAEAS
jgi:hypothetical protein